MTGDSAAGGAASRLPGTGPLSPGERDVGTGAGAAAGASTTIRVVLPAHLRTLAETGGEVKLNVANEVTQRAVLDALEARYPVLRGTIRDRATGRRRAFIRFYACERDLSNELPDSPLPGVVASGTEPFLIVGAMAGG